MKLSTAILAGLAVLFALYVSYCSGRKEGVRAALANQRDRHDDSTVAMLKREQADSLKAFNARQDSTGRVIRTLQRRIAEVRPTESIRGMPLRPQQPSLPTPRGGPVAPGASASACAGAPAQCDSLIASLLSARQQDSLQLLFWKTQVVQRDSLIPRLQRARDDWKVRAERRFACVGGATVAVGLNGQAAVGPGVTCGIRF